MFVAVISAQKYFCPNFPDGVVERTAAGGVVGDDKSLAMIDGEDEPSGPTRVGAFVDQEFLAPI